MSTRPDSCREAATECFVLWPSAFGYSPRGPPHPSFCVDLSAAEWVGKQARGMCAGLTCESLPLPAWYVQLLQSRHHEDFIFCLTKCSGTVTAIDRQESAVQ